ncbi:MAG: hypothetical protein H8E38_04215 [SAR324 cluster bacterium]|nr:hypothetical protein [SAR324 cluster bacterium]MBL7035261.1 hypothetical protein [SAR324 cluster bacterium]
MRHASNSPRVTLFPFLSVLLSTMGVLAFLSISFLLVVPETADSPQKTKRLQFEWVGAPGYVKPIFIRCYSDRIEYYNMFENKDYSLSLDELLEQLQGRNPELLSYLVQLDQLNNSVKKRFGQTEYYPLLLVYPDGILASELLLVVIEKIGGLNYGLEPMLPDWEVPYQGQDIEN